MKTLGRLANRLVLQTEQCRDRRKRIIDDAEVCSRKCKRCARVRLWQKRPKDKKPQPTLAAIARKATK